MKRYSKKDEYPTGTSGNQRDAVGGSEGDQQGKIIGNPEDAPKAKDAKEAGETAESDDKRSKAGLNTDAGDEPYPVDRPPLQS